MKLIARLTLVLIIMLLAAFPAMASTLTDATYNGTLRVTNSSDAASSVAAAFPLNAQNLIDAGYMASDFSNIAITYGGADMAFMPGHGENPWMVYVPSIAQNGILDYKLYTGGSTPMGGKLAYFPGDAGLTINDAAALELGNNFEVEVAGLFTNEPAVCVLKNNAFALLKGNNAIDAAIMGSTAQEGDAGTSGSLKFSTSYTRYGINLIGFSGLITNISAGLEREGTVPGNYSVTIRNANDDSIIAIVATREANSLSTALTVLDFGTSVLIRYPTDIRVLVEHEYSDATNYIAIGKSIAAGKYIRYGTKYTENTDCYLVGIDYEPIVSMTTLAGITSGDKTVKAYADGSNMYVSVDGVTSEPIAISGVPNNTNPYICFANGSMPYVDYLKVTVNGTLQQHLVYQYAETPVIDISGQDNQPASVSVRTTSSDADVSASLISFTPINESIASDIGVGGTSSSPIATTPTQPDNMYEDPDGTSEIKLPGAAVINDLLDASNTPYAFFWLPVIGAIIIFASYFTYKYAPSLLVKAAANWVLFIFFAAVGVFGFWTFVLFFICSWTMIVHSRSYGL